MQKDREEELQKWFEQFAEIGKLADGGYYRGSYTREELKLYSLLSSWMTEAGLTVRKDAAGNLWGRIDGDYTKEPPIVVGSHVDSVRHGGNFDGIYGVLGGLAAVKSAIQKYGKPRISVEVVAFTGEEGSRFSIGLMGSHAVAGSLDAETLREKTDVEGVKIADAMREVGLDIGRIGDAVKDSVGAYLEMHIEQGPVLEDTNTQIGIVDAIVGTQQFRVKLRGEAGHAGTVPMNRRKDPMLGAARIITQLPQLAIQTGDGVITVGRIWAKPDAENVIPGEVCFTVDLRHPLESVKHEMANAVQTLCEKEASAAGLELTWMPYPNNMPADMDGKLKGLMEDACKELGYSYRHMPSGAGHDALNMAKLGPVGLMFIPCRGGRSHCPEEYASLADMVRGVDVYERCIENLAFE